MTARRLFRRAAAWVAVCLLCGTAVRGQEAARQPINSAAPRGNAGQPAAGEARLDIPRQVYDQLLLRDRRARLVLDRVRRELEARNTAAALELAQHLLDRPADAFVWRDDESRLSSLRKEVDRLLTGSGREVLDTYQRLYGPEADRLLLEARRTAEPDRFREVVRRFFHTKAGFEATDWLAARWLDHGHSVTAARAWSRLIDEASHRPRVTRDVIAKTALAWHLAGDAAKARETLDSLRGEQIRIGGRDVSAEGWLAGLPAAGAMPDDGATREWPLYLGNPGRVRAVHATTPYPQPLWSVSFLEDQPNELLRLLEQWESQQAANLQPTSIANHPLVVDGMVVVRGWTGIRSFELATGQPAWSYHGATSLAEAAKRRSVFDAAYQRRGMTMAPTGQPELSMKHAFAENSLEGTLSADAERVYAVELADVRWPRSAGRFPPAAADNRTRSANRLIAIPIRPAADDASTPGGRGWTEGKPRSGARTFDSSGSAGAATVSANAVQPVWSVGGPAPPTSDPARAFRRRPDDAQPEPDADVEPGIARDSPSLAGYFFLGPPLPIDGRLYAIAEEGRELKLVVLEPETGRLLSTQGLAGVDTPIEEDVSRYFRACTPALARGVLVCPTGHGLLVALDPLDGTLLWSRFCGDAMLTNQPVTRQGGIVSRIDHGHGGFNAVPQIHGWRVLYLPPESEAAYCLDLATGEIHWTVARQDGEYIGSITDELVLIVGREVCRGVSLETGEVKWRARHGMPSGRGLHVGDRYLLPLDDGRVATIDLATGREIGNSHVAAARRLQSVLGSSSLAAAVATGDDWPSESDEVATRPGNLVAASGMIVSVGRRGVAVFRETGVLREELRERLRRQSVAPRDQLLAAELELMQGQLDAAESLLTGVLSAAAERDDRLRAEALLRELLYLRLDAGGEAEPLLARLEPLSGSRGDRGRFLLRKSELARDRRDLDAAFDTVRELAALDLDGLLSHPENAQHKLSPGTWARNLVERLAQTAGEDRRPVFEARLAEDRDAAVDAGGIDALERFLAVWSGWPEAAPARTALAERLIDRGRLHEAELLLLENRAQRDPLVAAEATRRLAVLWDEHRLAYDAGVLLDELATRFAEVTLADGRTGREFVGEFSARDATRAAHAMQSAPPPAVARVRVSERLWWQNDPRLVAVYRSQTPAYATSADSPLQVLLLRGNGADSGGRLSVVSHETGTVVGQVSLPLETAYPAFSRAACVGHFVPMGDQGSVSGLSLLELWRERPLWSVAPRELAGRTDVVRVGPAGPTFCAIQARRYLAVVDPADGRLLWQRTDINPTGEASFDTSDTLVGDGRVLVVFSPDRRQYVVYDTPSGHELRRGTLDIDNRQQFRVFGRRLVYLSNEPGGRRLKIWDPLSDRIEYESDAGDLLISTPIDDRELAFVLPHRQPTGRGLRPFSRLVIVDVPTAEVQVDVDLGSDRLMHLNYLRAFRDRDRYYINFQRSIANRGAQHYSYFATDTYLPAEHMQGDLYAIDAISGEVLWSRVIPQRSFLRLPGVRLPFLVALARARDRWNGSQQSLVLEVFDARTGETLGWKDNIFADRILQFAYRPEQGRLELSGWHTTVRLDFGADLIDVPAGDAPF